MNWIEVSQSEGQKIPKWLRTLGIAKNNAEIFVPAAIGGDELQVYLCSTYDGTPSIQNHGHIYVPAIWLSVEFPKTKELCLAAISRARQAIAENQK